MKSRMSWRAGRDSNPRISWVLAAHRHPPAVRDHIRNVVGHFNGRVFAWDMVNEAVDDRSGLRNTIFLQKLGDGYIAEAFRIAHETDPDAFLIYNNYGAERSGGKSDRDSWLR